MPKGKNQTLKSLYLKEILERETDENHPLTADALIERLAALNVDAERKSIYEDLERLGEVYGLDLGHRRGPNGGYYVGSREFEISELKILVDAVQSCRFITEKKSRSLIEKLEKLTNRFAASELQHQVYIRDRVKSTSETIYYAVDILNSAINANRQVSFHYYRYTAEKKRQAGRNGNWYRVSPYALQWNDSNYYLVAFDAEAQEIRHYRVDKMKELSMLDMPREGRSAFPEQDVGAYMRGLFGMYGGKTEQVQLRVAESLVDVIIDRFGESVLLRPEGIGEAIATIPVQVSPQFFGWVFGLGTRVKIVAPQPVCEDFCRYAQEILGCYAEKA